MIPSVKPPIWNTIAALSRSIWRICCDREGFSRHRQFLAKIDAAISCQKIRHSGNTAHKMGFLPRKHTVSLVMK
jgi:hypothetical protein